jgi:hypothetical protein
MPNLSEPLRLNYNSPNAETELHRTISNLPTGVEAYLISGSVRNALYRDFHHAVLIQRDYDLVITKGSLECREYLTEIGYEARPYPSRQNEQVVFCKALNEQAHQGNSYLNWLVLDMHTVDGTTIEENIKYNAGFSINGCAVNAKKLFTKPLKESVVELLPTAIQDIKDRRLRINPDGYTYSASNFYAMLRFMSVGFSAPSTAEVNMLLRELPKIEHSRFDRTVQKVWDYVGGQDNARKLVSQLGIDIDVFNEQEVKK